MACDQLAVIRTKIKNETFIKLLMASQVSLDALAKQWQMVSVNIHTYYKRKTITFRASWGTIDIGEDGNVSLNYQRYNGQPPVTKEQIEADVAKVGSYLLAHYTAKKTGGTVNRLKNGTYEVLCEVTV